MQYEIHFFPGATKRFGEAKTYQVEAASIMEAYQMWATDWPTGVAYYAKEGWEVGGLEIALPIAANIGKEVVEVKHLTPKERRDAMRNLKKDG